MKDDTVVPKALAIWTSIPIEGDTIRFSICVSRADEMPTFSANCCSVSPVFSRNSFTCWPTGTSPSAGLPAFSPDSFSISERMSSNVSSRVNSCKGRSLLQCVDVQRNEPFVFLRDDLRKASDQRLEADTPERAT
jgi:hypothetical protein